MESRSRERSNNTCRVHGDLSRCRSAKRAGGAFLEMRAASWSLLAITKTNTSGTFAIFLIFSSLTDVSFPRKHSKIFLRTRERTDSRLAICDTVTSAQPPALARSLDSTSACMALIRNSLVYCFFEKTVLTACRYTFVAPATFGEISCWGEAALETHVPTCLYSETRRSGCTCPRIFKERVSLLMYDSFVGKNL